MAARETVSNFLFGVAVISLVVIAGLTVRRELFSSGRAVNPSIPREQRRITNWRTYTENGHRVGPDSAVVTIVEFEDFECPVCGVFNRGPFRSIVSKYPGQVAVVYKHWPLTIHRLAYPAARAAECAAAQGRFQEYRQLLYDKQDSIGLKPFEDFAASAGVADLRAFKACNTTPGPVPLIESDISEAKSLEAHGTPTILVNGLMLVGAPSGADLDRYITEALASGPKN